MIEFLIIGITNMGLVNLDMLVHTMLDLLKSDLSHNHSYGDTKVSM